jgi:hypothetical protein
MFIGDRHRRAIEKFLKPLKVTLLHRQDQRARPILGVEWKTPSQVMFVLKNQDAEMSGGMPEGRNEEISVQVNEYCTARSLQLLGLITSIPDIPKTVSQLYCKAPALALR